MRVRCECGERGQLLNGPSPSAHPRLPIGLGLPSQLLYGPSSAAHPRAPIGREPIVQGYNIKTHNFYEIKVDF